MKEKIVTVAQGRLQGEVKEDVAIFRGVPFARAPVGALRWRGPHPALPWKGIRPALTFPACAVQNVPPAPEHPMALHYMSEECLYLNVWAPADTEGPCPVLVWFYGGALQAGTSDDPITDGEAYARNGVVLVTVNYRVGFFGFFVHPDMKEEDPNGWSGNFGYRDQAAALAWIRDNIAAFGGDPSRVTISGQSAGSGSCCALMLAPSARGLFQRAICHSGDIFQPERDTPLEDAEGWGLETAEAFGCRNLDELRRIPFTEFYRDGDPMRKTGHICATVIDRGFLPDRLGELMLSNQAAQIPVIIGSNYDEGSRWAAEPYVRAVTERLGLPSDLYSMENGLDGYATKLARDYWYGRQLAWAKIRSIDYGLPTWQYVFARRLTEAGAFHGMEMPYTFQTLDAVPWSGRRLPYTDEDRALSELMSRYWINFIRNGDPNGEGLPEWTAKGPGVGHMQFDAQSGMHDDITRATDRIVGPAVERWMRSRMG